MKLIIDIDENLYNRIQTTKSVPDLCGTDIVNAITRIQNGEVLPDNHGDTISRSALRKDIEHLHNVYAENKEWFYTDVLNHIDNAPTVEYTFEEAFQKTVCEHKLYCPKSVKDECNEWTSVCTGTCYGRDTFSAEDMRGKEE